MLAACSPVADRFELSRQLLCSPAALLCSTRRRRLTLPGLRLLRMGWARAQLRSTGCGSFTWVTTARGPNTDVDDATEHNGWEQSRPLSPGVRKATRAIPASPGIGGAFRSRSLPARLPTLPCMCRRSVMPMRCIGTECLSVITPRYLPIRCGITLRPRKQWDWGRHAQACWLCACGGPS